jgi:amidase
MSSDLWRWTVEELADAIKARKISSRETLTSCLARLEAVNPRVNAVVDAFPEEAFAAADRADRAIKQNEPLGPLHGVPMTVKINVDYAGRATTNGVVAFKDRIAPEDSAIVGNLRKAGAVIFGRTNVPAFSTRLFTDNDLHGRTLNPWDADITPGGSSGGAAAAVAVGIGPLAHGNDRAGSIRFPAYACGVPGLRPSIGRIPEFQPSSAEERGITSQLTHVHGPLARSVSDRSPAGTRDRRPDVASGKSINPQSHRSAGAGYAAMLRPFVGRTIPRRAGADRRSARRAGRPR